MRRNDKPICHGDVLQRERDEYEEECLKELEEHDARAERKLKRWKRAAIRLWQDHPCCSHDGKNDNLDAIEASLMIEKETP